MLNPESLAFALERGTEESLVALLAPASEKERKAALPVVLERLDREAARYTEPGISPAMARTLAVQWAHIERRFDPRPYLALLGTGSFADVKRYAGAPVTPLAFDVLAARRPKWLPQWCDWALSTIAANWPVVRRLVREGICERPTNDRYYLAMIAGGAQHNVRQLLTDDPGLLDHEVWELFQREGTRELNLENDFLNWSGTLIALSQEGRISRDRLLDASLQALELPFKAHRTPWYRNLHEALQPSLAERAARLPLYLNLTGSAVPATVKFALKAIELIDKGQALPYDDFLAAAPAALSSKEKGTASLVLRLLDRAASADPSRREPVAQVASLALEHPATDIQSAALALLKKLGAAGREDLVAPRLELASATVRSQIQPASANAVHYEPSTSLPDPLSVSAPIEPITSLDELVLTISRVFEQNGPPDDLERILDALSRLAAERPPHFDDLTSSLRAQTTKHLESGFMPQIGGVFSVATGIVQLSAAWLHRRLALKLGDNSMLLSAALGARPYWISRRLIAGQTRPLLSAPTHSGGWIDPLVLIERFRAGFGPADPREIEADLIQALYRLAPSHRAEAIAAAHDLRGPEANALRYALGADLAPPSNDSPLWIAARDVRAPFPREYRLLRRPQDYNPLVTQVRLEVSPPPRRDFLRLGEVLAAGSAPPAGHAYWVDYVAPCLLAWARLMTPSHPDGWCARGAARLAENLANDTVDHTNRVFLTLLLDPWIPLGPAPSMLLALGLMARQASESDVARDALIGAIHDRRLHPSRLGAALAYLHAEGALRESRLAQSLTETTRVSPLHGSAVRQIFEAMLAPGLPSRPAAQSALLEAFLEACHASGSGPLGPALRGHLESVSGSGKGPKLARALLALPAGELVAG